jgi:uncharacterized protein
MHSKVIYQSAKSLDSLGVPVLRFNFRGAGLSAGEHDRGIGERGDVQAAVDFLAQEVPGRPLLLGGFSFGSWVGLRVGCSDTRVEELIGLSIPVSSSEFTYLESCDKPKLLVHGTRDQHSNWQAVEKTVARMPGDTRLVLLQDADHFFAGHLDELDQAICDWLIEHHPELHKL